MVLHTLFYVSQSRKEAVPHISIVACYSVYVWYTRDGGCYGIYTFLPVPAAIFTSISEPPSILRCSDIREVVVDTCVRDKYDVVTTTGLAVGGKKSVGWVRTWYAYRSINIDGTCQQKRCLPFHTLSLYFMLT